MTHGLGELKLWEKGLTQDYAGDDTEILES